MVDNVSSIGASNALPRPNVQTQNQAQHFELDGPASNPGPSAPFISPKVEYSNDFDRTVLLIRDSDTGEVVQQYPSENQLRAYQRAQSVSPSVTETAQAPEASQQSQDLDIQVSESRADTNVSADIAAQAQQQVSAPVTEAVTVDTQA